MSQISQEENLPKCVSCKSVLLDGATRCASCGRFTGWKGSFFSYASWFGAIASVVSLITIAITGYYEVLAPKRPDMSVSVSEATFTKIVNLTCDASKLNGEKPQIPWTFGDPPGEKLLVEGIIQNKGNLAGEVRFAGGYIKFADLERVARPLAALDPVEAGSRYFVEPASTISFSIELPVFRDNSDGFYMAEVEYDPMDRGRKLYMTERLEMSYFTYEAGRRLEDTISQKVDFYLEPRSNGWLVDGQPHRFLCDNE